MKAPPTKANSKTNTIKPSSKDKGQSSSNKNTETKSSKTTSGLETQEETSRHQNAENVAPEKVEEIVESLVSAVILKVEAENVDVKQVKPTSTIEMKDLSDNTRRSSDYNTRRKVERDNSDARLGEILQQVFLAPSVTNNPVKIEKNANKSLRKASTPVASKPPKPPKSSSVPRHSIAKSSSTTPSEGNPKTTKNPKQQDPPKNEPPPTKKTPAQPQQKSKPEEHITGEQKKVPHAPPRKKSSKELLKTDSKKSIVSATSDTPKLELQVTVEEKGSVEKNESSKSKTPSRQHSVSKMVVKTTSERKQELQLPSLKSVDLGETGESVKIKQEEKPKAPPKSTLRSPSNRTTSKAVTSTKKPSPSTKSS
ncbi:hypothetical protein RB195_016288 [Necator americanus]|uniref:Uncharacterized protein n=1 Tax=Necator americanus TaxID=51031 RepID=A0ABR1E8G5_NECAM